MTIKQEIGFTTTSGVRFVPDKNLVKDTQPKIHLVKFGDGYEQRIRKGLNSINFSYNLTFANRNITETAELIKFFDEVLGTTAFDFTLPTETLETLETVKVVCDKYNQTFTYNNYQTITATFRRVYEP